MFFGVNLFWIIILAFVIVIIGSAVRILLEYERGGALRPGQLSSITGPGLKSIIPINSGLIMNLLLSYPTIGLLTP